MEAIVMVVAVCVALVVNLDAMGHAQRIVIADARMVVRIAPEAVG